MMKVMSVMSRPVITIKSVATLLEAAGLMKQHDTGFLVVMSGGAYVGVVTDRDIVVKGLAAGLDPRNAMVSEVMTAEVATCWADDDVEAAAALLIERKVRRLLVVDRSSNPVGVISLGDLAAREQSSFTACGVLKDVCADLAEPGRHR